ncbi:hypothetical protein TELCIR_09829 [Teladorsagia circumcincta]|uniref:Uncharacterized protein n=1 Tax=Teladorsagia circumcincta TaxID=45464 RepID=A0A2G9UE06_TELCI|nr:hypothetical protein TELCIR_09829 [Teladorsagia circumcincta]
MKEKPQTVEKMQSKAINMKFMHRQCIQEREAPSINHLSEIARHRFCGRIFWKTPSLNSETFIRSILGFILFSTSYCIVNTGIYYKFVRPLRQEERELLERELIEADRAGFKVNLK